MGLFSGLDRGVAQMARRLRPAVPGELLHQAGEAGLAWRVGKGVVRLDMIADDGTAAFASLAIAGDILGCETMLFGAYTFSAVALTQCELAPWPEGDPDASGSSLLESLANAQRRAAEIVALRGGPALGRVTSLIRLLADGAGKVVLPPRQDIAEITDLRFETISRIIKGLERSQVLLPVRIEGVHATRAYSVASNILPA